MSNTRNAKAGQPDALSKRRPAAKDPTTGVDATFKGHPHQDTAKLEEEGKKPDELNASNDD